MSELITLIALLCAQTGPGHGNSTTNFEKPIAVSRSIRQDAFAAQSACTKKLFSACTTKHIVTGKLLPKLPECLVEAL